MSKSEQISRMTDIMAKFVGYTGKVLPDDVTAKLKELHKKRPASWLTSSLPPWLKTSVWPKSWIVPPARTPA